jgi:serine/threonine protein kinase
MPSSSEIPADPNSRTENPVDISKTGRFVDTAGVTPSREITTDHSPANGHSPHSPTLTSPGTELFGTSESSDGIKAPPASVSIPGYEVLGELGRGGMGVVYKARQVKADRLVALKLMLHAGHAGSKARERFSLEVQAVARLQHPNIVQLYEVGETDGLPYFTLEYVPGGALSKKIDQSLMTGREVAAMMAVMARAISYAHRNGVIHRDLKPGNVLIATDGAPKIADFGLARKLEEDTHLTHTGAVVGTPSYMAPEQASGETGAGPSVDIYALGAILYELLTGRPPFTGPTVIDIFDQLRNTEPLPPSAFQPRVPRDLETICLKCLQKDAARRYASADELADDLDRFQRGEPIRARRINPVARAIRWCRRNPGPTGVIAISLLAAVLAGWAALTISAQKTTLTRQKNTLSEQFQTIKAQNDDIIAKQNALAEKEKLATSRLEVNRKIVTAFAAEVPALAEYHPLGDEMKSDLTELVIRLLNEARGEGDVGTLTDRGLLILSTRQGDMARIEKKLDLAEKHYRHALDLAEQVVKTEVEEKDKAQSNLSFAYIKMGELATDRKKHFEAIDWYKKALVIRQRLVDAPETGEIDPIDSKLDLGRMHKVMAEAYFEAKQYKYALPEIESSKSILEENSRRVSDAHRREMAEHDLALALTMYGNLLFRDNQLQYGRKAFDEALRIFKKHQHANPTSLAARYNLDKVYSEYGDWCIMKLNEPQKALTLFQEAQKQNRALCDSHEVVNVMQMGLALGYYRLGMAAEKAGQMAQANGHYKRCLDLREIRARELEEEWHHNGETRKLIDGRIDRMLVQARLRQEREVFAFCNYLIKQAADLESSKPKTPEQAEENLATRAHYELFAGQGLAILAGSMNPLDFRRPVLLAKAIAFVRLAVEHQFDNLWYLENDSDLDAIRPEPAYQAIVQELRQKQKALPK